MKQIKCKTCANQWYMEEEEVAYLKYCPFCKTELVLNQKREDSDTISTIGQAIYHVIVEKGMNILTEIDQLSDSLLEKKPDMSKEIRIFSRTFDNNYLAKYGEMFDLSEEDAKKEMDKLCQIFQNEEGLSKQWSDKIGKDCKEAIELFKQKTNTDRVNVEIKEYIEGDPADWRKQKVCFTLIKVE